MTALWQAVRPSSQLVSGMYLVMIMLGALWVLGVVVAGATPKLIAWWERRQGRMTLPILTEVKIILLTLSMVWVVMLSILLGSDVYFAQEWGLLPFPISPE